MLQLWAAGTHLHKLLGELRPYTVVEKASNVEGSI